jgi:hypothetical protein
MAAAEGNAARRESGGEQHEGEKTGQTQTTPTLLEHLIAEQAAVADMLAVEADRLERLQKEIESWEPAAGWLTRNPPVEGPDPTAESCAAAPGAARRPGILPFSFLRTAAAPLCYYGH